MSDFFNKGLCVCVSLGLTKSDTSYVTDCVITRRRSAAFDNKQYNHIAGVSAHLFILVQGIECPT